MYFHGSLLFAALMISWLARASCLPNSSYTSLSGQPAKSCPSDGAPVCGLQDKQLVLFSNDCSFNAANEDIRPGETIFSRIPLQNCFQGCRFSCLKTYKPICARNRKTLRKHLFRNQCELLKTNCRNIDYIKTSLYECLPKVEPKIINKTLEKRDESSRKKKRPIPCTNVFKPVCGSYLGVKSSFKNECILNAENVAFDRDWRIVQNGMCPEDLSKTRRRKDKPAKVHTIQKRSYDNELFNQYTAGSQLHANLDNKNELSVPPNNMYVYIPPTFPDEFFSQEYHQALTGENELYDEYLDKIGSFAPCDVPCAQLEETDKMNSKETIIQPVPFSSNRMQLNYMASKNLAHEINQQTSFPGATSIESEHIDRPVETTKPYEETAISTESSNFIQEKPTKSKTECQFGSISICATLANGTLRTFETICEMMTVNVYAKKTWAKLHEGPCDNCEYNCSRAYEPVCVSRNGVNYTMVNECYYNMAICMDKKSKWKMLSNKECDRYTRIPDKYSGTKPGFLYSSSYYVSERTNMTTTESSPTQATSGRPLRAKSNKNKNSRGTKRAINRFRGTDKCCSLTKQFSEEASKCECWNVSKQQPLTLDEPSTESYIMSLVQEKVN